MYKIVPWSIDLDLSSFYEQAKQKGFVNNASQHMLVDCFKNETEKQTWILYYNDVAVGSVNTLLNVLEAAPISVPTLSRMFPLPSN